MQLSSSSMFKVDLQLQTKPIKAIIDTAAEVTIISDKVYENLSEKPGVLRKVKMNTAGRDLSMTAFLCGPFHVKLGGQDFYENIYVAPLQDPMLLGLDFMRKHKVLVNIPEEHICIQDTVIPMVMSDEGKVAEVTVCKTTVIPPNVLMNIECMTDDNLSSYIVEPVDGHKFMVPPTAYLHSSRPKVFVLNLSDHNITLRKGQNIAQASEANVIPPVPPEFSEPLYNPQMQECQVSTETETRLPDHLCDMYGRARVNLDTDQQAQLRALLIEFQDVFAEMNMTWAIFLPLSMQSILEQQGQSSKGYGGLLYVLLMKRNNIYSKCCRQGSFSLLHQNGDHLLYL
ncbi:MAG: retropepsin-like domain-containing protein [Candidatus Thiodiazotropha taylori]|nr:retropepsin-like domain-containing protein [Candidatus Thiodiazotropha taylori]